MIATVIIDIYHVLLKDVVNSFMTEAVVIYLQSNGLVFI